MFCERFEVVFLWPINKDKKQTFENKHNEFNNDNWPEANKLAILQACPGRRAWDYWTNPGSG